MAILGGDGSELGEGEIGEIAIRGGIVMKEYWNRAAATEETLAGGWLHTGDVGYRDADGFYYVHDRLKALILSGGQAVYQPQVQRASRGRPQVAERARVGVPSARSGQAT